MTRRERTPAPIAAVSRTLAILERLADARQGLTMMDVSNDLGISPSVTFRIMASLLTEGFVVREPTTERYQLSFRLPMLGYRYVETQGFPDFCQPVLQQLANETSELVEMSLVQGDQIRVVAKAEGGQRVRVHPLMGQALPLHAAAAGKAWVAHLPESDALALVLQRGLTSLTEHTITDVDEFRRAMQAIRSQGYALSVEELMLDVISLAVPILANKGKKRTTVGTVAVVAPIYRQGRDDFLKMVPMVRSAVEILERTWPADLFVGDVGIHKDGSTAKRE